MRRLIVAGWCVVLFAALPVLGSVYRAQGEMVGEVTETSAILQSRLTASERLVDGDVPGAAGVACFEFATDEKFAEPSRTPWIAAVAERDFIVKTLVRDLRPNTQYWYRLVYGPREGETQTGPAGTFRTLAGAELARPVSLAVVTGMNYARFHNLASKENNSPTSVGEKSRGFPALQVIADQKPDYFVGTGDNVYYDTGATAKTLPELRRKWHEQFVQPNFVNLFRHVPTYWEKDDHDHRYNDCDTTGDREPSSQLGIAVFREQLPVVDPGEPHAVTYRTHRLCRDLQIWLVEGRDYRSPNGQAPGPEKTLWGKTQLEWLKSSLLASNATFKLLISPTPLIGPDDASKRDNHVNPNGFRHEGTRFRAWAVETKLAASGLAIVCGDRHWQYHSLDPQGVEEFSCGALVDENSRLGRKPGDADSTDPRAEIRQPYMQSKASGGFLRISVVPAESTPQAVARFTFFDDEGRTLYEHERTRERR